MAATANTAKTMKRREFIQKAATAAAAVAVLPSVLSSPEPEVAVHEKLYLDGDNDTYVHEAVGPGAFADLNDRVFDKLWSSWADMEL